MSACEREELLVGLIHGALDEAERREIEAHLATCAACRGELDGLRATGRALKDVPAPLSTPAGKTHVDEARARTFAAVVAAMEKKHAAGKLRSPSHRLRSVLVMALSLAASVLVVSTVFFQRERSPAASQNTIASAPARADEKRSEDRAAKVQPATPPLEPPAPAAARRQPVEGGVEPALAAKLKDKDQKDRDAFEKAHDEKLRAVRVDLAKKEQAEDALKRKGEREAREKELILALEVERQIDRCEQLIGEEKADQGRGESRRGGGAKPGDGPGRFAGRPTRGDGTPAPGLVPPRPAKASEPAPKAEGVVEGDGKRAAKEGDDAPAAVPSAWTVREPTRPAPRLLVLRPDGTLAWGPWDTPVDPTPANGRDVLVARIACSAETARVASATPTEADYTSLRAVLAHELERGGAAGGGDAALDALGRSCASVRRAVVERAKLERSAGKEAHAAPAAK